MPFHIAVGIRQPLIARSAHRTGAHPPRHGRLAAVSRHAARRSVVGRARGHRPGDRRRRRRARERPDARARRARQRIHHTPPRGRLRRPEAHKRPGRHRMRLEHRNRSRNSTATATCSSPAHQPEGNALADRRRARTGRARREASTTCARRLRCGAHEFRRPPQQAQAGAASAHGRAGAGSVRRSCTCTSSRSTARWPSRARRLAIVAPGLRHLAERRPDAHRTRHERGDLPDDVNLPSTGR